ncbi:serine hydrolase domain-containing protein [Clostridium sp. AM58-1XD]|uniref:serine hydrolase domain-containing protein n=1 Tax=Clostridium sp. AM58-1XD TaxID=2292307 RepID=UPI000E4B4457|nr:serine hydrolase domain-containing protein [Clostridium sp. AM58-1XD]RGZ01517.1 class A beta-lactamase-related serine hydrolase [Clostridium sp. AM58-1XD]
MITVSEENREKFERFVEAVMEAGKARGLAAAVIDKNGSIIYEKYWGYRDEERQLPINRDTIFGLASVTKSFTSLAIMKLAEDGLISIDDPVSRYVPEFTNKNQTGAVKIWHLMCHTGGFFPLPRIVVDKVAEEMGLDEAVCGDLAYREDFAAEGVKRVASRLDEQTKFLGRPGELFSYCNDGFGLLSDIIRRVSGMSFAEYLEERILKPLGMDRSCCGFVSPSEDDNAAVLYSLENGSWRADRDYHNDAFVLNGGGAMKSTISDMAKYICMYLNEGIGLNGREIAGQYTVREMIKPRIDCRPDEYYGYGLETKQLGLINVHEHGGSLPGVSSNLAFSYELGAGVMILCNTMDVSVGAVSDAAMRMISGCDPIPKRPEYPKISWTEEFIRQISGDYVSGEGDAFRLWLKEDGTPGMEVNGKEVELVPVCEYRGLVRKRFGDMFLQIEHDRTRGIWGARYGSRVFPKI